MLLFFVPKITKGSMQSQTLRLIFAVSFVNKSEGWLNLARMYIQGYLYVPVCVELLLLTCNSVWIKVPGLFCDIEDHRDKLLHPGGQFAKNMV